MPAACDQKKKITSFPEAADGINTGVTQKRKTKNELNDWSIRNGWGKTCFGDVSLKSGICSNSYTLYQCPFCSNEGKELKIGTEPNRPKTAVTDMPSAFILSKSFGFFVSFVP